MWEWKPQLVSNAMFTLFPVKNPPKTNCTHIRSPLVVVGCVCGLLYYSDRSVELKKTDNVMPDIKHFYAYWKHSYTAHSYGVSLSVHTICWYESFNRPMLTLNLRLQQKFTQAEIWATMRFRTPIWKQREVFSEVWGLNDIFACVEWRVKTNIQLSYSFLNTKPMFFEIVPVQLKFVGFGNV